MKHTFFSLPAKLHHWFEFTRFCFSEQSFQIREARQLTKLGMSVVHLLPESTRDDLKVIHFEPFLAHILGIYYSAVGHHDAVQTIALAGHGLDSLILLRPHLETLLVFLYVTEPQNELNEVFKRTDEYRDWVCVKMKQNMDRSRKLDLYRTIMDRDTFRDMVETNYAIIQGKYLDNKGALKRLEKLSSFINNAERERIASKFNMADLYHYIFAESSASIHFADIGDRMQETGDSKYRFPIRDKRGALWSVLVSNLLQIRCIRQFGEFFGLESHLTPKLQRIFPSTLKGS